MVHFTVNLAISDSYKYCAGSRSQFDLIGEVSALPAHYSNACVNQAESYFSRLRRMVSGQHRHVFSNYIYKYANQAAWLEDHR